MVAAKSDTGMKICIRMDDITPDMDWAKFLRFKELCNLYQVKPLIGVVPKNEDKSLKRDKPRGDFWEYIRQLQAEGWQVAQHGYTHVYATDEPGLFPLNRFSEFAGVEYSEQYEAVRLGQEILREHGIETDIFMAPGHSYDKHTFKALENLGYWRITDGFGKRPYARYGMVFYPIAFRQESALKAKRGYTTLVVHTNTLEEEDFARYERIFRECRGRLISYTELLGVEPVYRGCIGAAAEYLMALAKQRLVALAAALKRCRRKKG